MRRRGLFAAALVVTAALSGCSLADSGSTTPTELSLPTGLSKSFIPVLNGQVDIGSGYMPLLTPQLDTVSSIRGFALSNVFMGNRILAPEGEYVTVADLMAEGKTSQEAAAQAMEQLRGKKLLIADAAWPPGA